MLVFGITLISWIWFFLFARSVLILLALAQVQDSRLGGNNYTGLRHAFRSIIEREGFRALYTVRAALEHSHVSFVSHGDSLVTESNICIQYCWFHLQGLAPNLLGSAVSWGVYFQVYNTAKRYAVILSSCADCVCEHCSEFLSALWFFFLS